MSNLKVNTVNDASGGSNAVLYGVAAPANSMGFRNRIINDDMRIDQRNAGASISVSTDTSIFSVDRWKVAASGGGVFSAQRSTTAPTGFTNSLLITVTTADASIAAGDYYQVQQRIEGFNVADFGLGTASAITFTFSFWVRSSLTGTFGGSLYNSAANRSYPFTYTINAANTLEYKTVTVVGDTTGTWTTDNTAGLTLSFSLGTGSTYLASSGTWAGSLAFGATGQTNLIATNGATFYITGVQLEAGSVASPFERVDYGRQLQQCQRYYELQSARTYISYVPGGVDSILYGSWAVEKRASPTLALSATTQINAVYVGAVPTKSWFAGVTAGGTSNAYVAATISGTSEL